MARSMVWLRVGLLLYLGVTALVGGWAALWPRGFYDDFPWPGHPWVGLLPAYNEHLLRDFGGMNLAMAVVFGAAAVTPEPAAGRDRPGRLPGLRPAAPGLPPGPPGAVRRRRRGRPSGDAGGRGGAARALLALLHRARARPARARSSSAPTPDPPSSMTEEVTVMRRSL